jgi:predicted alpha/beta superfamily hydrolase
MTIALEFHNPGYERERHKHGMGKRARGGTLSGNIRVHEDFYSEILDNHRRILVYLPPGYKPRGKKRYPVLYVNDGQNVFDAETAFNGIDWGIDETLEYLIYEGEIREIIVVAVYNTPDRTEEYTYIPDDEEEEGGGGNADAYAAFLINELKPFIDSHYKTLSDAENTGIMGSSYGGLCALYLGWTYPEVFSIVAAISPSLWWANRDLISRIANDDKPFGPSKIWLDMGTMEDDDEDEYEDVDDTEEDDEEEDEDDDDDDGDYHYNDYEEDEDTPGQEFYQDYEEDYDNIESARLMGEVLLTKGYELDVDLFYFEDEGAGHSEWHWRNRVHSVLMALFPPE